jgi:hypothetical protein
MQYAKAGQIAQGSGEFQIGRMTDFNEYGQSQAKKGQAVKEVNEGDILSQKIGQSVHRISLLAIISPAHLP